MNHWRWLVLYPWLIGAACFAMGGIFQFSPLKQRALKGCRNAFRSGPCLPSIDGQTAWQLGRHHGLCCLGSCRALMLLMFGVGIGSVIWMAVLTIIMVIEKIVPGGRWFSLVVGVAALFLAALWIAHPVGLLLTLAG